MLKLNPGAKILFIGDSITDFGCSLSMTSLGHGYPVFIAARLGVLMPERDFSFVNTGVSGNSIPDLAARWNRDVLGHRPDVVSILIGINDTASRFSDNRPESAMEFSDTYRSLLEQTRKELPNVSLVLMEPFLLPMREDQRCWRDDLDAKIQVVRDLAIEFSATLIPLDGIFNAAACRREKSFWTVDGVHPTPAGHDLIAENWISAVSR